MTRLGTYLCLHKYPYAPLRNEGLTELMLVRSALRPPAGQFAYICILFISRASWKFFCPKERSRIDDVCMRNISRNDLSSPTIVTRQYEPMSRKSQGT